MEGGLIGSPDPAVHAGAWVVFAALWVGVAWSDYAARKIPNRALLAGMTAAALLAAGHSAFNPGDWGTSASSFAAGALLGIGLWRAGVWPAGDAKLLATLSLLAPLLIHSSGAGFAFPLRMAADGFLAAALAYAVDAWKAPPGRSADGPGGALAAAWLLLSVLVLGTLARWLGAALSFPLGSAARPATWAVLFMLGPRLRHWLLGDRVESAKILRWVAALVVFSGVEARGWAPAANILWDSLRFGAAILLFQRFILEPVALRLERSETETVRPEAVSEWALLSAAFVRRASALPGWSAHFGGAHPDGLTAEQAGGVRDFCRARGIEAVELSRTAPFAFWLFLGAALAAAARPDPVALLAAVLP